MARGGYAEAYQNQYWTNTNSPIKCTYNGIEGTIKFNGKTSWSIFDGVNSVCRTKGTIEVTYNGVSETYDMGNNPGFTLPFAVKGGYLNDTEEWK